MLSEYLVKKNGFVQGLTIKDDEDIIDWPSEWGNKPSKASIKSIKSDLELDEKWKDVTSHKRFLIVGNQDINDAMQIHEREVAHEGTSEEEYSMPNSMYQAWLTYFKKVRKIKRKTFDGTPEEAIKALNAIQRPY